jgi:hypothetical protein
VAGGGEGLKIFANFNIIKLPKLMDYNAEDSIFRKKIQDLGNKIILSTLVLLVKDKKGNFKAHGTGVLYKNDFQYFIITAAHVLDKVHLFALAGNSIRILRGRVKTLLKSNNNIDLCCYNIDLPTVQFLQESYTFISKPRLHLSHAPETFLKYLVVGFPADITKIDLAADKVVLSPHYYNLKMSKENVYSYYSLDSNNQYALDFKGKMENYVKYKKQNIGEPYGLSGSSLWLIVQKDDTPYNFDVKLIGIMTEFRKGKYHCLIGYKIKMILSQLDDIGGKVFYANK